MGKTIEELIENLLTIKNKICSSKYETETSLTFEQTLHIMQKYQKIEDIYYHQSGEALENSLRAVIENGNDN